MKTQFILEFEWKNAADTSVEIPHEHIGDLERYAFQKAAERYKRGFVNGALAENVGREFYVGIYLLKFEHLS